jgi:hypothetical protein
LDGLSLATPEVPSVTAYHITPSWWREPLRQWCYEAHLALGDIDVVGRVPLPVFDTTIAEPKMFLHEVGVILEALVRHSTVEHMLSQMLRPHGPAVLDADRRRSGKAPSPFSRRWLPLLSGLNIDDDLRTQRRELTAELRVLLAAGLEHEAKRRANIDRLPVELRCRIGAAGTLLLAAACVFAAARAAGLPQTRRSGRTIQSRIVIDRRETKPPILAELVIEEIALASAWLYGRARVRSAITLTEVLTKVRFNQSSVYHWKKRFSL